MFRSVFVLNDILSYGRTLYPDKVALVFGEKKLTYETLYRRVCQLSNAFIASGFCKGDRGIILLDNSVETVIALFAILKAGGIFSIVHPSTNANQLVHIIENCQPKIIISNGTYREQIKDLVKKSTCIKNVWLVGVKSNDLINEVVFHLFEEDIKSDPHRNFFPVCIDLDLAAIIYTSGSTGLAKGVTLTHRNMVSVLKSIDSLLMNTSDDVILSVLPLCFDYGLYQVFLAFNCGATLVLERSFRYPYVVLKRMKEENVTGLPGVPTLFAVWFKLRRSFLNLPTLRYITSTGASLPTAYINKLRSLFPKVLIYSMYGLTECKRVSILDPGEILNRPGSVGKPIPNVEVYIVDEQGYKLPPEHVGELVVHGSNVMQGYWQDPAGTAAVLHQDHYSQDTVLYTGDLFRMDVDGFLYYISRKDNMIKTQGMRVYPKEIEDVLYEIDGIYEAKVMGIPDAILGQRIKALVVLDEKRVLPKADIISHCARRIESYKVPHIIEFVNELQKTITGKIE